MLLDRALRAAFRNYWTLFLLVGLVTVTANLVYGFLYKDVLELDELHVYIRFLSPSRQVNGVGADDLAAAEAASSWVLIAEALVLPLLVLAARRVLVQDENGGVPTVPDALFHPRDRRGPLGVRVGLAGVVAFLGGAAVAVAVWYLADRAGLLLVEPLPDRFNYVSFGLVHGLALALAGPFLLAGVVAALRSGGRPAT